MRFSGALKTRPTRKLYVNSLKNFIQFLVENKAIEEAKPDALLKDGEVVEDWILQYLQWYKDNDKSVAMMRARLAALKLFYEMNRYSKKIDWKIITKSLGEEKRLRDRPYTIAEIRRMLDKADLRLKSIILTLTSTGMRVGALPDLKIRNLEFIEKYGIYRMTVYENTKFEYSTYCTPEAAAAINTYFEYRKRYGEKLGPDAPVFRDVFDKAEAIRDFDKAPAPRQIDVQTITALIRVNLIDCGIRQVLPQTESKKAVRHSVKVAHGFRKFFDTTCTQAGVHPLYVELLLGHNIALKGSYFRPTLNDLLEGNDKMLGYVAAINELTVNEERRQEIKIRKLENENTELKGMRSELDEIYKNFGIKKKT